MKHSLSRAVIALGIAMSLWLTSVAAVAAPRRMQDQNSSSSQQKDKDKNAKPQPATTQTARTKPLSTSEDPAMIGKRKINKGIWSGGILGAGGTESEVKLGRQLAAQVDREARFVDDPIITEYVNRVGQNIVLHSDAKIPFTIRVIDSDEVNAFALPGGFFYVNKGLVLAADNEAELAGVMAHEIAHVAARHAVENQTKGSLLEYAAIAGSIFIGGIPGMIYQNTAGIGLLGVFMKFSRSAESEANKRS